MAHNIRTTEDAGEITARPGDLTIAELAALIDAADPVVPEANIAAASEAHDLNAVFSDVEAETALDALGAKINEIIDALIALGLIEPAA